MDEYSLHQVLVDEHCAKVSERLQQKIVSKSVVDVSLDAGSSRRLLTLSECLVEIQNRHPDKQIDVVVDELDCEDLDEHAVIKLKKILELPAFKSSNFYISLQACQKKRQLEHNGKVQKETKTHFKDLGIDIFELEKTMRFTSNIGIAVKNSQEKVEEKPNIYQCNFTRAAEISEGHQEESVPAATTPDIQIEDGIDQTFESSDDSDSISANPEDNQGSPMPSIMKVPTMKMDSSFRFSEVEKTSTKIISYFEYIKTKGSGINIAGDIPNLLRINKDKNTVQPLAYFLDKYCQCEQKMMLICNTKVTIALAKAAMETVGLPYVEYTDSIRGLPAKTTIGKKSTLDEWRNDKKVLLVDCRGCRGMECQEVFY